MTFDNGQPQRTFRDRRRRPWIFVPVFFALLLTAVAGAIWHWRLPLAERALSRAVRYAGIEMVTVSVDRLDFAGAELSNLRFGSSGSQRIAGARITWSMSGLLDRRLRAVEISGADLRATIGPDGRFAIEGLPLAKSSERPTGRLIFPKNLPFERVDVVQSHIFVTLPDGQANVGVEAHLEVSTEALFGEITARYSAETQRGGGTGRARASITWAEESAPRGEFELEFDRLIAANATGTKIRLFGSTDGIPARLKDMSFRAEGFAEGIEMPQLSVRDVGLTAELSGGILDVRGDGKIFDWAVELSSRLQPFDLTVPVELVLNGRGDAATISKRVAGLSADGIVAIEIDVLINDPLLFFAARDAIIQNPLKAAEHVTARLNIEVDLQQFALSDLLHGGSAVAVVSANWHDGILDVDIDDGSHFDAVTLAPILEEKLVTWLPGALPFDIALTGGMGSPPTVRLGWTDTQLTAQAVGGVDVALPDGVIEIEVDGKATATLGQAFERIEVAALKATLRSVPTMFGSATGDVLITDLSAEGGNLAGVVGGEISVTAASTRTVSARQLTLNFDGAFSTASDEMSVVLSPGGWITARDVRLAGGYALPGTTRLQFAGGSHRLALNRRSGRISVDIRLRPGKANLKIASRALGITHGAIGVSGTWPGGLTVDAEDVGTVLDKGRSIDLADLRLRADGKFSDAVVSIAANGVEPKYPGLALPSFDATAKIIRQGSAVEGELEIIATGGQPSLRARGQHSLKTGKGNGEILAAQLRFAPGVLQPEDINPAMAGTVENVFAKISLTGPIAWEGDGAVAPNLTLVIDDLAAATDGLELFDASVTVLLTGLPDLETPPGQRFVGQVRVGRLDPVPIEMSFQLLPALAGSGPRLIIEQLAAQLAQGRLTTEQFMLTPPSIDTDVTLRLEDLDLARAFAVIGVAGIGGTGRIGGKIPLIIRGSQVAVSGGRLANDGPGEVFYDFAALPQPLIDRDDTVTLVLRALSNFAYDDLQVELDKALDGPGSLRIRMTGANPDVLENHPFVFNITLESNFDRLAALVLEGLTTSQGLLRALALSSRNATNADALP